jgi:HTH-type transcriptional regulator, competence development regulator
MADTGTSLGNLLKASRQAKQLSLRDVERKTKISNPYLSQLESGKIQNPAPKVLYDLAQLYEISYVDLMRLADYPVPNSTQQSPLNEFASRLGPTSEDEQEDLIGYLKFLRTRKKSRR